MVTDRYAELRAALPVLVEEARREGGTNPRAQMIINLLADYDRLRTRLEINDKMPEYDGIACRDVTIEQQDKLIDRLREIVEMMAAGNAEYDALQAAAQAALAQEQP